MKKIFITGATGKSGLYFYEELKKNASSLHEFQFDFIVRNREKGQILLNSNKLNQKIIVGDITDKSFIHSVICRGGYDTILHIAGIHNSEHIVKSAVASSIKRIILVHTTGIYSKYKAAGEEYRQIESRIEEYIKDKDVQLTYLRPTMIYGNLNDGNVAVFIKMVDKLRIFPVVNGAKYELQPVWCGDLGKAYYQVLMNPQTTIKSSYILSGGKPIMLKDMFVVIAKYLSVRNRFVSCPFIVAYTLAWALYIATIGKIDYREKVQRLVEPRIFDYSDATRDFGYSPLSFEDGVKEEICEYIRANRKSIFIQ